jgi:sialate O-acetylesterase
MVKSHQVFKSVLSTIFIVFCLINSNFSLAKSLSEGFTVASILQSNMVVQQDKPFKLWGTAKPGDKVLIIADWNGKTVEVLTNASGKWIVEVIVPKAIKGNFNKHTITIKHQEKKVELTNILIGEVWVCSGQSNMELTMQPAPPWHKGVENYSDEIAAANYPNIRIFNMPRDTSSILEEQTVGKWEECTSNTVNDFSGVAYYFGRELLSKLDIPIGLIKAAYGGASCQAFIPRETLESDTLLKRKYLDKYLINPKEVQLTNRPSLMFNKMINPLTNLSIRGFLWYQGESNSNDKDYVRLCTALINSWRANFAQGDLPFYYVQMTPYNWKSEDKYQDSYAYFRESQQEILKVSNTGMAITMDVGVPNNIHPSKKKEVGLRLAKIALNKSYNQKKEQYLGPQFQSFKVTKNQIVISFTKESVKNGLATKNGLSPNNFFIAGEDRVFKNVEARIKGKNIILLIKNNSKPVAIRYAFLNANETNLENTDGLPAMPFRSDDWDKVNYQNIQK